MAHPSLSFRISRSAEDLAETIHALSQRLVALEHRLATVEVQLEDRDEKPDPDQEIRLEKVERLLRDCRDLLATDPGEAGMDSAEVNPPRTDGSRGADSPIEAEEQGVAA